MENNKLQKLIEQQQILKDDFKTLVLVDYDYECTDKSYFYKIVKIIDKNGKPMKWPHTTVQYKDGKEVYVGYSHKNYKRSYKDYATYEEALEEGVKEAAEIATICNVVVQPSLNVYGELQSDYDKEETIKYLNHVSYINPWNIEENEDEIAFKKLMDYLNQEILDIMKVPDNVMYKHDETISPLMKYCQPRMTINLDNFLDDK